MLKCGDVLKLVRLIAETRETEIGCDECFEWLDSFAEAELSGVEATVAMPLVSDHLNKCKDCHSKFEALMWPCAVPNTTDLGRLCVLQGT